MSEPHRSYDLLIIGGGLAGATLGRSMTLAGAQVLIIEKETEFRDRIRGEVLLPWGSIEAKELGIYDVLLQSCAREAPRELFFLEGEPTSPRDFLTSTPQTDMRAFLLSSRHAGGVARRCGEICAEVWRGAAMRAVYPGERPEADILLGGETKRISARLIVGADGRESQLATLLNFERERDPPELFTGGPQLAGEMPTETALYFFLHGISGRGSILIQNKPGNYRIYLLLLRPM